MEPIPKASCPECGRLAPHYYDERDRHMAEEFKAGTTTTRIAQVYGISQRRVHEILIDRLGQEAMWRIIRTHAPNKEEEE